jgi:hypothetical protein
MNIYCPHETIPLDALAELADDAAFSTVSDGPEITQYQYKWDDLEIAINVMPDAELEEHLKDLVEYAHQVATARETVLDEEVSQRILFTQMVLGFVVTPDCDTEDRHERLTSIVGTIAFNTESIVFWEDEIFDENAEPMIGEHCEE